MDKFEVCWRTSLSAVAKRSFHGIAAPEVPVVRFVEATTQDVFLLFCSLASNYFLSILHSSNSAALPLHHNSDARHGRPTSASPPIHTTGTAQHNLRTCFTNSARSYQSRPSEDCTLRFSVILQWTTHGRHTHSSSKLGPIPEKECFKTSLRTRLPPRMPADLHRSRVPALHLNPHPLPCSYSSAN